MSARRVEFLKVFDSLPPELQERVIGIAQTLASKRGVAGRALVPFAGTIPAGDLEQMRSAIEDSCERIDEDW